MKRLLSCGIDAKVTLIGIGIYIIMQSILAFVDYAIGAFLFVCVAIVKFIAPSVDPNLGAAIIIVFPGLFLILLATLLYRSWITYLCSIPIQLIIAISLFWVIGSLYAFEVVLVIHLVSIAIQMVGCLLNMLWRKLKTRKSKQLAVDIYAID